MRLLTKIVKMANEHLAILILLYDGLKIGGVVDNTSSWFTLSHFGEIVYVSRLYYSASLFCPKQ